MKHIFNELFGLLIAIGIFVGGIAMVWGVDKIPDVYLFQKEAIEHGYAYYHPQTAQFTWKENRESDLK